MKKLRFVMMALLCACLIMGFTVPNDNSAPKKAINFHKHNAKWKNTTWVNPWVNAKKINTKSKLSLDVPWIRIEVHTENNAGYLQKCNLKINNVAIDLRHDMLETYYAQPGSPLLFEIEAHPSLWFFAAIYDYGTMTEIFYCDNYNPGPSAQFQWTSQAGHNYGVELYLLGVLD